MSWQLASYGLLGLALAAGFAWYERTRPDARIVALVGTLAALGALGRIAFAAIPNIKPTTDIVLIAGYALGGGPGFVVGAVAALTSNFFFGQGPWTPWQMAGWGATGMLGAGLALLSGRRLGRAPLAAVCFVVGFAFTALQDVGDWVNYSDHSTGQLAVYVGKGVGFDLIHATGCLLFALAFGPALSHSLQRVRGRLQVRWLAPGALALVLLAAPAAGPPRAAAATSPQAYLLGAQNRDGGFGPAPGQPSSTLFSGWAALGLEASGLNPAKITHGGATLLGYLQATLSQERDPGSLERVILALHGAGVPTGGPAAALRRRIAPDGSLAHQTNLTAFAVLALRAAGAPVPARTLSWLAAQQDGDGGFNFSTGSPGAASDPDDTGAVLEALAGHAPAAVIARAVHYLQAQQNRDGGYPAQSGGPSNAQSTAFAVQGLIAAGRSATPGQAYLQGLIRPDGHVAYARGQDQTPVWVTAEAEMALAGRPLPLAPVPIPRPAGPGPVSPKPPARPATHAVRPRARMRAIHHRRHRGTSRRTSAAPAVPLETLASDAGFLTALVLAPVDNP